MISVVVPIFNSENTIQLCIESVLNQSFTDLELILVDDGSTDNSGQLCDEWAEKDGRIKVIHQLNKGRTEARHQGVQLAKGEWLTFVDSDDTLPKDALSMLFTAATDSVDIVLGNGYSLAPESRSVIPMDEFRHKAVRADGMIGVPWGSLYRRSVLIPYLFDMPRHIMMGEDYIFWLRLVFTTDKPVAVVYDAVYDKGEEHTSNSFVWTSDYCYELNELRQSAIPTECHHEYLSEMLNDRIANLFAVAICQNRRQWVKSRYYKDIMTDMKTSNYPLGLTKKLFLQLPSLRLRKWVHSILMSLILLLILDVGMVITK